MGLIKDEELDSKEYELKTEEIEYKNKLVSIVKLTSDNVARVEAMIATDSDYKNSWDDEKNIMYKRNGKVKYIGSSHYWLKQLKEIIDTNNLMSKDGFRYEQIINNVIIAIDNENSTHLNSDRIGRNNVKDKILGMERKELKEYLKNSNNKYELIKIIQTPKNDKEKNHLSFASKFCHYACLCLFQDTEYEDNYSIYDNILKNNLPKYIQRYLDVDIKKEQYENNYNQYIKYIDDIRNKAEKLYGKRISRNGFDHLLWYYHKGKE